MGKPIFLFRLWYESGGIKGQEGTANCLHIGAVVKAYTQDQKSK